MTGWRRWLRLTGVLASLLVVYFTVPLTVELGRGDVAQLAGQPAGARPARGSLVAVARSGSS